MISLFLASSETNTLYMVHAINEYWICLHRIIRPDFGQSIGDVAWSLLREAYLTSLQGLSTVEPHFSTANQ